MKIVEAKLISQSKPSRNRREPAKAQVAVCLGEGSERRSITCHVVQQADGSWTGRNPDPQAEKMHKFADKTIVRAQASLKDAERDLAALGERKLPCQEEIEAKFAAAEKKIADYQYAVKKLGEEKEKLNEELPLVVQFKF